MSIPNYSRQHFVLKLFNKQGIMDLYMKLKLKKPLDIPGDSKSTRKLFENKIPKWTKHRGVVILEFPNFRNDTEAYMYDLRGTPNG